MNPAVSHLLCLHQSNRAIEKYVEDFCGLCHLVGFNDVALKDIFRAGLNKPIRSQLPGGKIHWSLEQYIHHALLLSGSSYTVGVAEEECNNPPVSAKPESAHVMPATPESAHVMPAMPESAHVMPAMPESAHVIPATPESAHVMPATPESARVMPATPESAHVMPATPESAHVMPAPKIFPKEYFLGGYIICRSLGQD